MVLGKLLRRLTGRVGAGGLPAGATVAGRFRVIRRLGAGAWSTIYEVESLSNGRRCALKQTHISELGELERQAVINELRLLASLHHPNVLQYNASFADSGDVFLVMDLVSGGDLAGVIRTHAGRGQRIPEHQVWTYLLQAARGLHHMHSHSIIHRDIKPANLLLTDSGLLKIADLGVAGVLIPDSCVRQLIGTAGFMAPELLRRECQSFQADIFSLGICLYEICALRTPFSGSSEAEVEAATAGWSPLDAAAAAATLAPHYSPELRGLLAAMLQPDPNARPTAAQLLETHGTPDRLARLPAPPALDACGRAWDEAAPAVVPPLLPPISVPADLQQLNEWLPQPCCGRAGCSP